MTDTPERPTDEQSILCACGCGTTKRAVDASGRTSRFIRGHARTVGWTKAQLYSGLTANQRELVLPRFESSHIRTNTCWQWQRSLKGEGYGGMSAGGVKLLAHQWSYLLFVGPITPDLEIDHLCRNRGCVNPAHLELVTTGENVRRGNSPLALNRRKTHCIHGHEYTRENTVKCRNGRQCRTCKNAWERAHARH